MSKPARYLGVRLPDEQYHPLVVERIRARCIVNERGCWVWQGFKRQSRNSRSWYGMTNYRGSNATVHRIMISVTQRPVGFREVVMHLCDNSLCANPAHLAFGTIQENLKDAAAKGSYRFHKSHYTHCKHGHPFDEQNTRICKNGFRHCKECERVKQRQYWADGRGKARRLRYLEKRKARLEGTPL